MAIIVDLEAVAVDEAGALCEPVSAPANYKDPVKIAAYIAEAEQAQRERAALHPFTAKIAALGAILDNGVEHVWICKTEDDERLALGNFERGIRFDGLDHLRPLVGFNHLAYDLPVITARAMLLDVPMPAFNLDRYRNANVDLMKVLTFGGTVPARSLNWYAKRFGIAVNDAHTGADVARLVAEGDWDAVRAHCLSDLRTTKALAERIGVIRGGKVAA